MRMLISSIVGILSGISNAIAGYLRLKSCTNRQRREAEEDVRKHEEELGMKKQEIQEAVYTNDDDKINRIVEQLLAPTAAMLVVISLFGCVMQDAAVLGVKYVATDRRIETCTNSIGIVCKAVPNAVFSEMLEQLQELKDLRFEMKVDKRVGQ